MEKTGGGSVTHVRRNQAGVQPFIRNRGPSLRRPWVVIWRRLCLFVTRAPVSFSVLIIMGSARVGKDGLEKKG